MQRTPDLRRVGPGDAESLSELVQASFLALAAKDWEPNAVETFLAESSPRSLAAALDAPAYAAAEFLNAKPVGFLLMSEATVVTMLFVHPEHLRRGIARRLWQSARSFIEAQYSNVRTVETNSTPYALPAYRSLGFAPISGEFLRAGCRATRMACGLRPRVINVDDYLETESGRVFTAERNREAWSRAYAELEAALAAARPGARFYVVFGVQGAGKSSWIARNLDRLGPGAIVFDAALPAKRHRAKLLELAARFNVPAVGVYVQATLEEALSRNAMRPADTRVPEDAIRSVFGMLEPPSRDEGFESHIIV